jgi:HlyD family secretion protein
MEAGIGHLSAGVTGLGGVRETARLRVFRNWWIAAIVFVGSSAGLWYLLVPRATTSYTTVPATRGMVERAVTATGSVNPILTITVGSYVSGVIRDITCDFNTVVKKNQLCAQIDPRPYTVVVQQDRAAVATARAQLLKDQANLAYARVSEQRQRNLLAAKATSQDSYDVAKNAFEQAKAQVALDEASIQQHQAELDAAEVNLGYTRIISPVDGIVVSRNITIGQTVAASFQTPTLFLIATNLSTMEVDTNVSESDIGGIRAGNKAHFTVDAYPARIFDGTVMQVRQAPQTVQNVVTYDVVVQVDNKQGLLKPGMTATMRIVTDARDHVLRVPNQSLRYAPGGVGAGAPAQHGPQIWIIKDGRPKAVAVRAGLDDDNYTEIAAGDLAEGVKVIVSEQNGGKAGARGGPALRLP